MSDFDKKAWKEYLEKKRDLDGSVPKEILDKYEAHKARYELHKQKVLASHYKHIQEDGEAYLEKLAKRRKELYHLRKEKKKREKEEAKELELARAKRAEAGGNPFGKGVEGLKLESDSDDDLDSINTDIYCSTCPTDTDTESVVSIKQKKKPVKKVEVEVKVQKPQQESIQRYFSSFNYL